MKNNKKFLLMLVFLLNALWVQADGNNPEYYLKKHYLSRFTDPEQNNVDTDAIEDEFDEQELESLPLDKRMTPFRLRTILLRFICPECYGKAPERAAYPVQYHSDIWRDTQVFNVSGKKAHLYDAVFPGSRQLGELYGAYQLVAGATADTNELMLRQFLIRQIRDRGGQAEFREAMDELDEHLARGVAIFDKAHLLNHLADLELYDDEKKLVDWFNNVYLVNRKVDDSVLADNAARRTLVGNLNGGNTQKYVRFAYGATVSSLILGGLNYKMTERARSLPMLPWNSCANCFANSRNAMTKLGGYASYVATPLAMYRSVTTMYQAHWNYKKINRLLTDELMALKPFLETLFSFQELAGFSGLPLLDFSLDENEQVLSDSLLLKIDSLSTYNGHLYQRNLVEAASAARILLLLRETIARYLVNIARLDFYTAVAEGSKNSELWNFASFDTQETGEVLPTPMINAKGLWNPLLPAKRAVPSGVKLGQDDPASIVLTGANASGKSTFLRNLGINTIFMAQTLGIAAGDEFEVRPFTHFDTLMDKRDARGRSSYQTEMDSVLRSWANHSELPEGYRSLVLADELFRTTNAKEGDAASRVMVNKLGQLPHMALVVSTHYKKMKKLAVNDPDTFANKHMSVEIDPETGDITRMNYRLVDGPSPSSNARQLFDKKFRKDHPEFFK